MNITITNNHLDYTQEEFNPFINNLCASNKNNSYPNSHPSNKIDISNLESITSYKCNEKILNNSICTNNIHDYTITSFTKKLSEECPFYQVSLIGKAIEEPILSDNCFKSQDASISDSFLKEVIIGSIGLITGVSIGILGMQYYSGSHNIYSLIEI